ncbi:MAG: dTDP-4-dehydrorhamnose reductase [Leeuwenhoekiella sp.]
MVDKKFKILVTGGGGQLAQCLEKQIVFDGNEEYYFANRQELDITSPDNLNQLFSDFEPDVVINTAAYTQVDQAEADRDSAYAINTDAVKNLARACQEHQALLIHISTDYVFDGDSSSPYHEDDSTDPKTVYGASKRAGEEVIINSTLKEYYIIRTSWLYSEFGKNFYKTILRLARERDELSIVDDQQGCPTNANDLARGILKIVSDFREKKTSLANFGIYHFSNAGHTTWYGFAKSILEINKISVNLKPVSSSQFPTKSIRPKYSILSNVKFQENFNFKISHWEKSLEDLIATLAS